MNWFKKFASWLFSTTRPHHAPPPIGTRVEEDDNDLSASFHFRDDILDQLDEYFLYLKRMRRSDPTAYALYSNIGANVVAHKTGYSLATELSAWWRAGKRPAFGATAFLYDDEKKKDHLYPKFLYFQKMRRPWFVAPFKGDVYEVTLFYDNANIEKSGLPVHYYIGVDADAKMTPLRHMRLVEDVIPRKHERGRTFVTRKQWYTPVDIGHKGLTPIQAFVMIADAFENSQSGAIRVSCNKGDLTAIFAVEMKRTAYFFKDRSTKKEKRIFHVVRPHERVYQSGKTTDIKFHFRGVRDFEWNGYDVHITVPGLHHANLIELEASALLIDPTKNEPRPKGFITQRRMALEVRQELHR